METCRFTRNIPLQREGGGLYCRKMQNKNSFTAYRKMQHQQRFESVFEGKSGCGVYVCGGGCVKDSTQ